ncbi:MAG TPA: hypothetical protein VK638_20765 [Edaphobacter sp.]|jgi:hypothetical protein|nr:hypothetical protein [Edaphobacter sp.]
MKKSPEEDLERVLTGLRDSAIPDGMERRILAALENRASSPSSWRSIRPALRKLAAACSFAMAAALAFVFVPAIRRPVHAPQRSTAGAILPKSLPRANANQNAAQGNDREIAASAPHPKLRSVRSVRRKDAAPQDEGDAASYPPPPMPLTDEERLLLRAAHWRAPVELAELSPARRALQDEQERVDFERFFEPPKTETIDATKQPSENKTK